MLSAMLSESRLIHDNTMSFLVNKMVELFPSKVLDYLSLVRYIGYTEKNIKSPDLIISSMIAEGEDEEIITNIQRVLKSPTIKTPQEAETLRGILEKLIKYKQCIVHKKKLMEALEEIDENDLNNIEGKVNNVDKEIKRFQDSIKGISNSSTSDICDSSRKESIVHAVEGAKATVDKSRMLFTGIKALNEMLSPAYLPEQLYVYVGLPGNYKSGILLTSFCDACKYNKHIVEKLKPLGKKPVVIYMTMENTMAQTIRRLWSLLFPNINFATFAKTATAEEMADMIHDELEQGGFEAVIMYKRYREISTYEFRDIINYYNNDEQQVVGVFFDYIKRIRPGRTDASAHESEKSELETICNECKAIASEFGIPFVTGHQLNRTAAAAVDEVCRNGKRSSDEVLNRSQIGSAWGVQEIADMSMIVNIDTVDDDKFLMIKNIKIRDVNKTEEDEDDVQSGYKIAFRHPFLSPDSFSLRPDIFEPRSLSVGCNNGSKRFEVAIAI